MTSLPVQDVAHWHPIDGTPEKKRVAIGCGVGATIVRYHTKQPMNTAPISVLTSIEAPCASATKKKMAAASATPMPVSQRLRTLTPGLIHSCSAASGGWDVSGGGPAAASGVVSTCSIVDPYIFREESTPQKALCGSRRSRVAHSVSTPIVAER